MSDEVAKQFAEESHTKEPGPSGRSVTLSITLHPNGQIDFQLPANNKILCYGLLESARAQLDKLYFLDEQKAAKAAQGGVNGLLKRINGG